MKKLLLSILFAGFLFTFSNAATNRQAQNVTNTEISLEANDLSDRQIKKLLKLAARELGVAPGQLYKAYRDGDITIIAVGGNYYHISSKTEGWGLLILLEEL